MGEILRDSAYRTFNGAARGKALARGIRVKSDPPCGTGEKCVCFCSFVPILSAHLFCEHHSGPKVKIEVVTKLRVEEMWTCRVHHNLHVLSVLGSRDKRGV